MMTVETVLLGDGVAAMSLAAVADQLPTHSFTVMQPEGAPEPHDHMLGFWNRRPEISLHLAPAHRGQNGPS